MQVKEAPGMEYQILAGNPAGNFVPNLFFFVNQAHRGSLDEFVSESLDYNRSIIPDLKIISQEDLITGEGARGVKVVVESTQRNLRVRQTYYFFEAGARKFTATYTRLANAGQGNDMLVDESMKTFRLESVPGVSPAVPQKTLTPARQVILIANLDCQAPKITSADEIIVRVRWGAASTTRAESNADHFTFVFLLDGQDKGDIRPYRQPAETYSGLDRYGCGSEGSLGWVHWDVPIGRLPAGRHTVSINYILDEPITDGLAVYSAGPFGFFEITFETLP
jgi:hypothetical protein